MCVCFLPEIALASMHPSFRQLWTRVKAPPKRQEEVPAVVRPKARRARTLPMPCASEASAGAASNSHEASVEAAKTDSTCAQLRTSSPGYHATASAAAGTTSVLMSSVSCPTGSGGLGGEKASFRQVQKAQHRVGAGAGPRQSPPSLPSASVGNTVAEALRRSPDTSPLHEAVTRLLQTVEASDRLPEPPKVPSSSVGSATQQSGPHDSGAKDNTAELRSKVRPNSLVIS